MDRNLIGPTETLLSLAIWRAHISLPGLFTTSFFLQRRPWEPDYRQRDFILLSLTLTLSALWLIGNHRRQQNELRDKAQIIAELREILEKIKANGNKLDRIMAGLPIMNAHMDVDAPVVVISDGEEGLGTREEPIVLGSSDDEVEHGDEIHDGASLEEFHLFTELPIELRLQIWNLAFPSRVVNLTFDENRNRWLSFNSSPPLLLQIHRETRELALKTYKQCFGSGPAAEGKFWIDFTRDVVLVSDDYIDGEFSLTPDSEDDDPAIDLSFEPNLIQNLAFSADHFCHKDAHDRIHVLRAMVKNALEHFSSVKKLYIVYEDGVNPYSRGRIRFFPVERTCLPTCDSKGCFNIAMIQADCQDAVDALRKSKAVVTKGVDVRFVGAWRGGSRAEYGHALDGYEDESGDEFHNPEDDPEDGYASEDMETPDEIRGNVEFTPQSGGRPLEMDDEATFSDHEGWRNPEIIPEIELQDLKDDENAYRALVDPNDPYDTKQGHFLTLTLRDADDYYEWRKKEHPARCFPIHHPDGSYRAV